MQHSHSTRGSVPPQSVVRLVIVPKGDTLSQISLGIEPVIIFSCNSIVSTDMSSASSAGIVPPRLFSSTHYKWQIGKKTVNN